MAFSIREAADGDLAALLSLYAWLHPEAPPAPDLSRSVWHDILTDPMHHILLGESGGAVVSSCVLVVIPNLTRGARPYALIENVITHPDHRGRHFASALLQRAVALAAQAGCYKVMLLTGRKDEATQNFYRNAGFNCEDKTAFVRWL